MLSTPEKLATLRLVSLFAETPDNILAEVADLLQEITFAAGETIFEQGDPGDALYIIGEGSVRVHSGGRTLSIMESRSIFGEMAALDPQPRSASVTAVEAVRLLRLERAPLYQLIVNRGEVATGIIRVLSQLLRARTTNLVEDYQYLQQVARLTEAASAVEAGVYEPQSVAEVTERTDALGQLARVFQRMIGEVYAREQRLKQEVLQLRIEINKTNMAHQVAEITETDYFRALQDKARQLRAQAARDKI
ncbi:hypothetical protein BH10CHL1_BH10CHL1_06670 [soil metagenome]